MTTTIFEKLFSLSIMMLLNGLLSFLYAIALCTGMIIAQN